MGCMDISIEFSILFLLNFIKIWYNVLCGVKI